MISSFASPELEPQQKLYFARYDVVHPYEESGRFYGCLCGEAKDNPIHAGAAKLDAEIRLPSYWERA
jgi:hypothetical protein